MTVKSSYTFSLAVVGVLVGIHAGGATAQAVSLPPLPKVRLCILPPAYVTAGETTLRDWLARNDAFAAAVETRLYAAPGAPFRVLPTEPDCEELAGAWVARHQIPVAPMAIYALGSGFVVFQPEDGNRGGSFILISPSHEVVGQSIYAAFE